MACVLQHLLLVGHAPIQQANEVQAMQLELQRAVQIQEPLTVGHGPSAKHAGA